MLGSAGDLKARGNRSHNPRRGPQQNVCTREMMLDPRLSDSQRRHNNPHNPPAAGPSVLSTQKAPIRRDYGVGGVPLGVVKPRGSWVHTST